MNFDVITIGTATQDTFLKSRFFNKIEDKKDLKNYGIISGEATCFGLGSKIEVDEPIVDIGGGAVSTAITFSRQGLKTAAVFKIGKDEAGKSIISRLKKEKVSAFPSYDKKTKTASSSVLLSPDGERTILVYRGASEKVKKEDVILKNLQSKWVYIVPGKINIGIIKNMVDRFHAQGASIAINPSKTMLRLGLEKLSPIFKKTKVLIINREEAAYLTGIDYGKENEIFKKIDSVFKGVFLMTDGRNGSWISDNKNIYYANVFKGFEILDETGAGDAFGSGFVAGLIHKRKSHHLENIEYAIRLGSANAASVVQKIGAQEGVLTKKQFESEKRWKSLPIKITKSH